MKMRREREGFTLVELLVVITIIGMLMALLLPAIQAAREAGRRAVCMNNEKNLGLAMLNFQSTKGMFPGMVNEVGRYANGTPYFGSWLVPILPSLERPDVYELWTTLDTTTGTPKHQLPDANGYPQGFVSLPLLVCPSNPTVASPGQMPPNAYRVNAGRRGPSSRVVTTASAVEDTDSCGVFDLVSPFLTTAKVTKNTALSIDGIRDGASNTLMLAENTRAGDTWAAATDLDPGNLWKSSTVYDGKTDTFDKCEASLGFRIPQSTTSAEGLEFAINKNIDGRPDGEPRGASPASYHPGIVIATFCDGHVRPLDEDIDPNTYLHMITPNGKKAQQWAANHSSGRLAYFADMTGVLNETN